MTLRPQSQALPSPGDSLEAAIKGRALQIERGAFEFKVQCSRFNEFKSFWTLNIEL